MPDVIYTPTIELTENDVELLSAMSNQLATALANAKSFQEEQRRGKELAVLNEMGQKMTTLLDVDAILEAINEHAAQIVDTTNLYIALYDQEDDLVDFHIQYHNGVRLPRETRRARKGLAEYIIQTQETLLLNSNIEKSIADIMRTAVESGGTISGEHGIGLCKKKFMAMEAGNEKLELMHGIKSVFDPKGIMNPGKVLP
jgi:FAD/FMN-containing dehydrogenase